MQEKFAHIDTWVFDLDNTLYPQSDCLFHQMEGRMRDFIQSFLGVDAPTADALRVQYYHSHGTTLAGLMDLHGMDPQDFLEQVHDVNFSVLSRDPVLAACIANLPGRKLIYTNGTAPYARNVIAARGLAGLFDAIYGVEDAGFRPKPERRAFEQVFKTDGLRPNRAAMFEDAPRNLQVPHDMGMTTVHVAPIRAPGDHIQHHTDNLTGFLTQLR